MSYSATGKRSGKKFRKQSSQEPFDGQMPGEGAHFDRGSRNKPITAKTAAQKLLMGEILKRTITFAEGPAGSGKTYVSASLAAQALQNGEIEKIIITRPMVPCEEDMGFFPGTEAEKFAPWLIPIIEVLQERLGAGFVKYAIANERICARPLMTMRGSSFEDSWILMDEAQNTTPGQMKMFLTRVGENCKVIVSGDLEQSDLQGGAAFSGMADAIARVSGLPDVGVVRFSQADCVRSEIVRQILARY